ncbi:MAG: 2-vinyl bacteriochlorophyllide hydratase [Pseudomonadota bacterium]
MAGLYTEAQRQKRDSSPWTTVQAILAPAQFLVCFISVFLIVRYMTTGEGLALATYSILIKTGFLYTIMVTGAIWEKDVFGQYLFVEAFFWEDVFSMAVLFLHTLYLAMLVFDVGGTTLRLNVALAAYLTYFVNAGQFVWKLRLARLDASTSSRTAPRTGDLPA